MNLKLKITNVEKITVRVPYTTRNLFCCAREQYMWDISEIIRLSADVPGRVGYGETISPLGKGTDVGAERVKGQNPALFLGDDSLGTGVQMAIYNRMLPVVHGTGVLPSVLLSALLICFPPHSSTKFTAI